MTTTRRRECSIHSHPRSTDVPALALGFHGCVAFFNIGWTFFSFIFAANERESKIRDKQKTRSTAAPWLATLKNGSARTGANLIDCIIIAFASLCFSPQLFTFNARHETKKRTQNPHERNGKKKKKKKRRVGNLSADLSPSPPPSPLPNKPPSPIPRVKHPRARADDEPIRPSPPPPPASLLFFAATARC